MPTDSFSPPQVKIGDMVYWYSDPLSCAEPNMGWVSQRPGAQTISVLVFTPYTGFQEKPSCRHRPGRPATSRPATSSPPRGA